MNASSKGIRDLLQELGLLFRACLGPDMEAAAGRRIPFASGPGDEVTLAHLHSETLDLSLPESPDGLGEGGRTRVPAELDTVEDDLHLRLPVPECLLRLLHDVDDEA